MRAKVIDRLANVLYWAACLLAAGVLGLAFFMINSGRMPQDWEFLALAGGLAFAIWLVGRAIRYVLSGR